MKKMKKLGLIGCGKMGSALLRGLLEAKRFRPDDIVVFDIDPARRRGSARDMGVKVARDNVEVVESAATIILAVKPNVVPDVLSEIAEAATPEKLFISIAAGVRIREIESALPAGCRVVRVMPNTPCLVRRGASAFALGSNATDADAATVGKILEAVGMCEQVSEELMDAVTGLSGSGPAYVFVFIEALADGGVRMGLSRKTALQLAAQTVLGAAQMVIETGEHPGKLKDDVASPGGTTIAGLHALEKGGFRAAVIGAVEAATKRSKELSGD